jgi:hypothetical protein
MKKLILLLSLLFICSCGISYSQQDIEVQISVNVTPNKAQFLSGFKSEIPQGNIEIFEDGVQITTVPLTMSGTVTYNVNVTNTYHTFYAVYQPIYNGGNYTFKSSTSKNVIWFPPKDIPRGLDRTAYQVRLKI